MLPGEVQSYIRHILHVIGMLLVARAGYSHESAEMFAAMGVNVISLGWFIRTEMVKHKKARKNKDVDSSS